jgi:glycosyltransferase involved in cell wall biosynthesis
LKSSAHKQFRPSIVVAIPVKNEADRIAYCLHALSAQAGIAAREVTIVLLLNNCTDETATVVDRLAPSLPILVRCFEVTLSPDLANAGYARHLAMEAAEELADPQGVLLTTDADGRVDRNWIALNLRALQQGADAVAGRIEIDPVEAALIPTKLHEDDARESAYSDLLDRIDVVLDPDPFDPWPRHREQSGASIAVTVSAYRRAGGIPTVPLGEDRAFFAALRRVDARIRHAPGVRVVVSGRTTGRAVGGMADTIRRRMIRADDTLDDRLEPALDAARRARLRKLVRIGWSHSEMLRGMIDFLARQLLVLPAKIERALKVPYLGQAWANLERTSASLLKRPVLVADLQNQTEQARLILQACTRRRSLETALKQVRLAFPAELAER